MEDQVFNYIDQRNAIRLDFLFHHIDEISDANMTARAKIYASGKAKKSSLSHIIWKKPCFGDLVGLISLVLIDTICHTITARTTVSDQYWKLIASHHQF